MKKKERQIKKHVPSFIIIMIFGFIFVFEVVYLIDAYSNGFLNTYGELLVAFIGVIVTAIICYLTSESVKEVIKSNKENQNHNESKDRKNTFEKQFSLLLAEHNNYLNRLIQAKNKLYSPGIILSNTGIDTLSIIRGYSKGYTDNKNTFIYHDFELLLKIDIFINKNNELKFIKASGDTDISERPEFKGIEFFLSESGNLYQAYKRKIFTESFILNGNQIEWLKSIKSKIFTENKTKVIANIENNNLISKNILSPYMRIIYHILKLAEKNTSSIEEMKSYTNIIRSVIPYDVLILVAVNSMFFYRVKVDNSPDRSSWLDFIINKSTTLQRVTNDYLKYFKLLMKCDFFEHLTLDYNAIMKRTKLVSLDLKIEPHRNVRVLKYKNSNTAGLVFFDDYLLSLEAIYNNISLSVYSMRTDILIMLLYKKDDKLDTAKKHIMKKIFWNERNKRMKCRFKDEFSHYSTNSFISESESIIFVTDDFLTCYMNGKMPVLVN